MTIPADERQYIPPRSEAVEQEPTAAEQEAEDVQARYDKTLRAQCSAIRRQLPVLWQALNEHTVPIAESPTILPPSIQLTSGEMMAFRMGQRSVYDWLERSADINDSPVEAQDDG